jgi:hypothetical protein
MTMPLSPPLPSARLGQRTHRHHHCTARLNDERRDKDEKQRKAKDERQQGGLDVLTPRYVFFTTMPTSPPPPSARLRQRTATRITTGAQTFLFCF